MRPLRAKAAETPRSGKARAGCRFPAVEMRRVKTLLSEMELQAGISRLAQRIENDYSGRSLTILGVMTGSVVVMADLIRRLALPLRVGVVQASSYKGGMTAGPLSIAAELMPDVAGRDVLVLDDIFDTGRTMLGLLGHVQALGPRSVRSAVLLLKEGRQEVEYRPDYVAFHIPDLFVVGYGLDYRDQWRQLPYVATLESFDLADAAP